MREFEKVRQDSTGFKRIDGYDSRRYVSLSSILVADGIFDTATILERFRRHSKGLDPDIISLVVETVRGYNPSKDDQSV